jgi:hypothetical protein
MTSRQDETVELVSAGIDWLTMTLPHDRDKNDHWLLRAVHNVRKVAQQGNELKERTLLGYYGVGAGNCFAGQREDGRIAQFTGYHADAAFDDLYLEGANISRIDLQCTVRYKVMPKDIARRAYNSATSANRRLPEQRRRKLYIIVGSDGGDTFYCGSASSAQRGRLYNKEVQSEDPLYTRTWRYEVVYRNDTAKAIAAVVSGRSLDRASTVCNIVATWWENRGVSCAHFKKGEGAIVPLFRTLPTEVEAKLLWLRKQVRPTVRKLIELGMADEVSDALDVLLSPRISTDTQEGAE